MKARRYWRDGNGTLRKIVTELEEQTLNVLQSHRDANAVRPQHKRHTVNVKKIRRVVRRALRTAA